MLAVIQSETVVEHLAELLLFNLLEAWTGSQGQELEELSQLLIELWQSTVLPHLLNLLERQITVTIFVVEI